MNKTDNKNSKFDESKLWDRLEREKTERWRTSYEIKNLEDIEIYYNIDLIQHKCSEWIQNLSEDHKQYADLQKMLKACTLILAHTMTRASALSRAAVEVSHHRMEHNKIMIEMAKVKNTNKALKSMIEHYEKEASE